MPNFDIQTFFEKKGFTVLFSSSRISFQLTRTTTGDDFMVKPSEGSFLLVESSYGEPCENLSLEELIKKVLP